MENTYSMKNDYGDNCANKMALTNDFRSVWEQHVWWTRMLILNIVDETGDLAETVDRLMQNPKDMAAIFRRYYTANVANLIEHLITEHLSVGAEVIKAAKTNNTAAFMDSSQRWYRNAYEIAKALSSINPYYNEDMVRKMFYDHLDLTIKEVQMRLAKNYAADIMVFNAIEKEALQMADYFSAGILSKFKNKF